MKVKPKKAKVSGLPTPRFLRSATAWRPNSIKQVLSGWSDSENASNRSRIASRKRHAWSSCSKSIAARLGGLGSVPIATATAGEQGKEEAERFKDYGASETWCPNMVVVPAGRFRMG